MDTDSFIFHVKTEDFYEISPMMLKNGFIHQIMSVIDPSLKE